mmetsp:Transcript_57372/g.129357  ORF Transcript_57372/g.129357 Transcript_57372/m.129357 type:complete len:255 (-) Transcript_57372:18-782(-)
MLRAAAWPSASFSCLLNSAASSAAFTAPEGQPATSETSATRPSAYEADFFFPRYAAIFAISLAARMASSTSFLAMLAYMRVSRIGTSALLLSASRKMESACLAVLTADTGSPLTRYALATRFSAAASPFLSPAFWKAASAALAAVVASATLALVTVLTLFRDFSASASPLGVGRVNSSGFVPIFFAALSASEESFAASAAGAVERYRAVIAAFRAFWPSTRPADVNASVAAFRAASIAPGGTSRATRTRQGAEA